MYRLNASGHGHGWAHDKRRPEQRRNHQHNNHNNNRWEAREPAKKIWYFQWVRFGCVQRNEIEFTLLHSIDDSVGSNAALKPQTQ